jgi:Ca2+-binding EF-hand superfamily protein
MFRSRLNSRLMVAGAVGVVICSSASLAARPKQDELPTQSRPDVATTPAAATNARPAPLTREGAAAQLRAQFQTLDTNKDGFLSQAEIAAGIATRRTQVVAAIRKQREAAFQAMDTNKDGQLSRDEFMAGGPKFAPGAPDGSKALNRFDVNKDGKVSLNEYLSVALSAFDKASPSRPAPAKAPVDSSKKGTER